MTVRNYTQLEQLHAKYAELKGLRILLFPCNQFGGQIEYTVYEVIRPPSLINVGKLAVTCREQEPWPEAKIKEFAQGYSLGFDLFSKINVNGSDAHPLFKYLKNKQGGTLGDFIKWNFTKFLVDKEGIPVKRYAPNVDPETVAKDFGKYW